MDIAAEYARAKRLAVEVQDALSAAAASPPSASSWGATETQMRTLDRSVRALRTLAQQQGTRRAVWESKVRSLAEDYEYMRTDRDDVARKRSVTENYATQRAALFGDADLEGGGGASASDVRAFADERGSINRSGRMVDEYISTANLSIHALRDQGGTLKQAQRRLLDIGNSLGLSKSLLGVVQTRAFWDKVLVYGGMIATLIMLLIVYRWKHRNDGVVPLVPSLAPTVTASAVL
jgi:Golgi SNAP receptor complex protein 2|tara:strand:- start:1467 stop:2171 length:705 start_codon:yes stop_codon:yes gene_type:complete